MAISKIAKLTLANGENDLRCGVIDKAAGFIYFLCHTYPGKVVKIRLSDFTVVATLTFAAGEDLPRSAVIDSVNGFMYVCCYTGPGKVVKIRLSDFTAVGTLIFPTDYNNSWSLVVAPSAGYLYAFCYGGSYDVVKISLGTFTVQDYINIAALASPFYPTARIDIVAGFAYCGTYSPVRVVKVGLNPFSEVAAIPPASGAYSVSAAIDIPNGYYFVGSDELPGKISRVILSSFLSDTFLTLAVGENDVEAMCVNPTGKLLYACCNVAPGKVVRINIATFARLDVYAMPFGDDLPYTAVIDESTRNIYVGTNTGPGTVIKLFDGDIIPPGVQHLPIMGIG